MIAIWALVARQAGSRGGRPSMQDLCAAAVAAIQVSGAGLMAVTRTGAVHVMCVTDEISERLADIELTLGEGPRADASAFGGPALASDLTNDDIMARWPAFAPAARAAGAAAVFAFPLQIGAIRVGVLELYRSQPRPLATVALGDALLFADAATLLLLESQQANGRDGHGQDGTGEQAGGGASHGPGGQPMELGLRRAEIGHHHHIAGAYLLRYAQEASWREDNRRVSNGDQVQRVSMLAMHHKQSVDFCGYWQRHIQH